MSMIETAEANVSLSDRAARRIAKILSAEPGGTALRVSVSGGGCSGFQYGFDLDATRAPTTSSSSATAPSS